MDIYTDGSTLNNGKAFNTGGFGVIGYEDDKIVFSYSARSENTTNNREEMKAIIYAIENYGNKENPPTIYTDSSYCYNMLTDWIHSWAANGWRNSRKREPENMDLVLKFWKLLYSDKKAKFELLKGHSGIEGNEFADKLATGAIKPGFEKGEQ